MGCEIEKDVTPYEKSIQELLDVSDFVDPSNYDVEVVINLEDNIFYLILDNFKSEISNISVIALPTISGKQVAHAPQIGILDDEVSLSDSQKGLILSGEFSGNYNEIEILVKVKYMNSGEYNVDYLKISENLLSE